ncbi:WD40 repeat domain-containing protein [Catellatospora methionotrophica]|uniref:WD40 repeat domain-containing protein n=1 Tax=Catellatospora methionotrophica TaxID=121620 RepID=UPI0033C4F88B
MRVRVLVPTVVAALLASVSPVAPAVAAPRISAVVSTDPVDWTPHIRDGAVWAMAVVGDTVVVGGDFGAVAPAGSRRSLARRNLMAFRLSDGAVTSFSPDVNGVVTAIAAAPDGSVIIGGDFTGVNGYQRRSLARLDVATGGVWRDFQPRVDGDVRAVAVRGSSLYIGGRFTGVSGVARQGMARLNAHDGAVDTSFDADLTPAVGDQPTVESIALSPDGNRLVAVGNFAAAQGQPRAQLVMIDVAGSATVADWHTPFYETSCHPQFDTYLRDVDFSPDGRYLVAVTTGHDTGPDLPCNTTARFEAVGTGTRGPTWVNHTGGHSLYAVAATGSAVYVGGHQLWLDNPDGQKVAGPGAVERPGIGAIDPMTGRALEWNPTRTRGVGVRAFAVCPLGLLVGSDTDELGNEYHGRIGMFPDPAFRGSDR